MVKNLPSEETPSVAAIALAESNAVNNTGFALPTQFMNIIPSLATHNQLLTPPRAIGSRHASQEQIDIRSVHVAVAVQIGVGATSRIRERVAGEAFLQTGEIGHVDVASLVEIHISSDLRRSAEVNDAIVRAG